MQVGIDVKCMRTNFGRRGFSGFGDKIQIWLNFPFGPWTIVHEGQKIELDQKIHVEVDVKCMQTNFGEHGPFVFEDFAPFLFASKQPNFPFKPWTKK